MKPLRREEWNKRRAQYLLSNGRDPQDDERHHLDYYRNFHLIAHWYKGAYAWPADIKEEWLKQVDEIIDFKLSATYAWFLETEVYGGEGFGHREKFGRCIVCNAGVPVWRGCDICIHLQRCDLDTGDVYTASLECPFGEHQKELEADWICRHHRLFLEDF